MLRRSIALTLLLIWVGGITAAQTSPDKNGAQLYAAHCAGCHGKDAKGDGPAAPALKVPPPDLTTIAQKNRGRFPDGNLFQIIKWGGGIASHGSKDMPVWGRAFTGNGTSEAQSDRDIRTLVKYIESLQVK